MHVSLHRRTQLRRTERPVCIRVHIKAVVNTFDMFIKYCEALKANGGLLNMTIGYIAGILHVALQLVTNRGSNE